MIILREYQKRMTEEIKHALYHGKNPFVVAPTGSGKMIIIAALANEIKQDVLIVEHRLELIDQATEKLQLAGEAPGIIAADRADPNPRSRIKVCMIQTAYRRNMYANEQFNPSVVIIDEAHLAAAKSYRKLLSSFPFSKRVCFSATPSRLDGEGFTDICDRLILGPSISQLTAGGFLVPINHASFESPDFSSCRISNLTKDYNEEDVAKLMDRQNITNEIIDSWSRFAKNRITVVFATNVNHSKNICIEFRKRGIRAEHIDGSTDSKTRKEVIRRIRTGQTQVLCNCGIVVEGFDAPIVSCVILATPTKSVSKYLQCVGRGMRPHPESYKKDLIILDFGGCEQYHGRPDVTRSWTLEGKVKRPKGRPRDDDFEDYEVKSGREDSEQPENLTYYNHIAKDVSNEKPKIVQRSYKLVDTARVSTSSGEITGYNQNTVDYQLAQRIEENTPENRKRQTAQSVSNVVSPPFRVPDRWQQRKTAPRYLPHGWETYWNNLEDYRLSNGFSPNYSEIQLKSEMRLRGYRV